MASNYTDAHPVVDKWLDGNRVGQQRKNRRQIAKRSATGKIRTGPPMHQQTAEAVARADVTIASTDDIPTVYCWYVRRGDVTLSCGHSVNLIDNSSGPCHINCPKCDNTDTILKC